MGTHKDLLVWQKSIQFVTRVYEVTKVFPKEELYCIVSQIRRTSISIPSNIAEGSGRKNTKELIQFLYISLGSASELETHFEISKNLGYFTDSEYTNLCQELHEIIHMISALIKSLSNRTA